MPDISSLGSTTFFDLNGAVLVRLKKEKLSMGLVAQMKKSSGGRLIAEAELEEMRMKKSSGRRLIAETELEEMRDEIRNMRNQFENLLVQTEARLVEAEARHMEAEARHIEMEKLYVNMEFILRKQVCKKNTLITSL